MKKQPRGSKRPAAALRLCAACALCLILSACGDIFQYITRLENGADRHIIKISFRNGEGLEYWEEFFMDDRLSYEKFGARITQIENDVEFGYKGTLDLQYIKQNMDSIIAENPAFIPRYTRTGITIPLPELPLPDLPLPDVGAEFDFDNNDEFVLAMPGTYRLVISKRCMADIRRAELAVSGAETGAPALNLEALDLGDCYLVEVPLGLFVEYRYLKLYSD